MPPSAIYSDAWPLPPRTKASRRPAADPTSPPRSSPTRTLLSLLITLPALAVAQSDGRCISLRGSTVCPAFGEASISTNASMFITYPFLQFVSDTASFDYQLSSYVETAYIRDKYQNVLGCRGINYSNSSNLYARYTMSVLCNTLVQQSIAACSLSADASRPLCADACADFARSEAYVTADSTQCSDPSPDLVKLIRADFATCSLPEGSLTSRCIPGSQNEPLNCGFANSTLGLCSYCAAGGINSTDTCCYNADATGRCQGITLPTISTTMTFSTPTSTSTPSETNISDGSHKNHLSRGAIAGIVIGSVGAAALLGLLLFFCLRMRKRREGSHDGSIFNQPSPIRKGPSMLQMRRAAPDGYEVLPGGRIARMSALEGHSDGPSPQANSEGNGALSPAPAVPAAGSAAVAAAAAAAGGYATGQSKSVDTQSSKFGDSPESEQRGALRPPPSSKRQGSPSSGSLLASDGPQSPASAQEDSSPGGAGSQQSEQLPFFKDYYSDDDIHPTDKVAVLWAYQPRAADEFSLERGDMLKVVGIWDDGWATGIMLDERAEEWEARRQAQRDSGVSNTSGRADDSPAPIGSEMKAFPLVCVCLPEHWKKTIDGDGPMETPHSATSPNVAASSGTQ